MNPFDQFLDSIYIDQFDPAVLSFLLHVVDLLRDSALTSEDRIAALENGAYQLHRLQKFPRCGRIESETRKEWSHGAHHLSRVRPGDL